MTKEFFIFIIIVVVSTLGQVTSDMYLPALPAIQHGLNTSINLTQTSVTSYMFGYALTPLIYGPLSDGIGRRKPMIAGLFISILGTMICAFAFNITLLLIGRLLQGFGTGACGTLARSILRDKFEGETLSRYLSYAALIGVILLAIGPLIGSYLLVFFNWRAIFIFIFLLTTIEIILFAAYVRETNMNFHPENLTYRVISNNFKKLIFDKGFLAYAFFAATAYGTLIAWLTSGSVLMQLEFGFSPIHFGWICLMTGASFALGATLNSYLVKRYSFDYVLKIALSALFLISVLSVCVELSGLMHEYILLFYVALIFIFAALIFPNATVGALSNFRKIAGSANALLSLIQVSGGILTSAIIAFTHDRNSLPFSFIVIGLSAVSLFLKRSLKGSSDI